MVGRDSAGFGVYAITAIDRDSQFWAYISFQYQGGMLTPQLTMGLQTWANAFMDHKGRKYPGDLAKLRRHTLKELFASLVVAIPVFGLFALLVVGGVGHVRRLFQTNHAVALRDVLRSHCGDSSDPYILGIEKRDIKDAENWTTLLPAALSRVEAMKAHTLHAVTVGLSGH